MHSQGGWLQRLCPLQHVKLVNMLQHAKLVASISFLFTYAMSFNHHNSSTRQVIPLYWKGAVKWFLLIRTVNRAGLTSVLLTSVWFSSLSHNKGKNKLFSRCSGDNWDNKGQVVWFSLEERFLRNLTFDYCSCIFSEEQQCGGDAKYQSGDEQISHLLGKCAHQISILGVRRRMRFLISLSPKHIPAFKDISNI